MTKLDLGCGTNKAKGYIGVDKVKVKGVDIVCDCEQGLPFDDNSVDEVRVYDFLEHIHQEKIIFVMNEIWRVLKPNGILKFKVPDAERGQGAFQDPTHRTFWVKNSFKYYAVQDYEDLYGIKAHFKIGKLESVEYTVDYWGKNYCLLGYLIAIKKNNNSIIDNRIWTTDDLCLSNLKHFKYWDEVKKKKPDLKLIAFTIANYHNKEDISQSKEFQEWFEQHKDWVEIQPHGYSHNRPQLGWKGYKEQKEEIQKCLEVLKPYLPEKVIFRFPGFRTMPYSEQILKECGIDGVAHQNFIKMFATGEMIQPIFNSHCGLEGINSIIKIWQNLV